MHIEYSHVHSNINICTWTHRCIHPESHPEKFILMQTDLYRCTNTCPHRRAGGHTYIHMQTEVDEQMIEPKIYTCDIEAPKHR